MNFLAHEYLSKDYKGVRVGNFLGDFIRRIEPGKYSEQVLIGIELHKKIDQFTDSHPLVHESKIMLHPRQGKYSSVLLDIYYDYFLAKNWDKFSDVPLNDFATSVYDDFWEMRDVFPEKVVKFLPNMREQNWFYNYRSYFGIDKALQSIARRAKYSNTIKNSLKDLQDLEVELEEKFMLFFPELVAMSNEFLAKHNL
ncbi:ACP phosphodiesterase [Flavobacteriales bacterium]|nr:ACP phosphodiesterase [Flavobacteriales bacterium]